ncbi:recombinase family protein [Rhizobium sp. BK538]|uniref:recombinase family protein n=1 Tax=Rhizobium sp. BK538 TaxID=2586984 RepID=UPI00161848FE|nr:recombinase family protein [Rhizobium sp. BK538]MBB4170849.1 putative site-specific integrase-resolvase [Rhizobium sp. BK538]
MLIGYARVSKGDQQSNKQARALSEAGCKRLFEEKASGGRWDRPELHRMLDRLARRRHRKLDPTKRREIAESVLCGRKSGAEMARLYDISEPTVSRIVAEHRKKLETSRADQS